MKNLKVIITAVAFALASASTSFSAKAGDYDLPAVGGYDLVSYHQDGGPVRGSGYHATQHEGVTYLFANEENKTAFEADPEAYLPAYNGYCAYGVAVGQKFNTDPTVYEVVDGTLYLNLDAGIQKTWSEDIPGNIAKADANWKDLK